MHKKILELIPKDISIEYISHINIKKMTEKARAIIRTGEFTPYPSIILIAGCAY